jgi:hypothetical protein
LNHRRTAYLNASSARRAEPSGPLLADFVAEVGAESTITLTLHTPNEAAALVDGYY